MVFGEYFCLRAVVFTYFLSLKTTRGRKIPANFGQVDVQPGWTAVDLIVFYVGGYTCETSDLFALCGDLARVFSRGIGFLFRVLVRV